MRRGNWLKINLNGPDSHINTEYIKVSGYIYIRRVFSQIRSFHDFSLSLKISRVFDHISARTVLSSCKLGF